MKRLKDSNSHLLLISVAILAALFGLAVLGRNLYRTHYVRQQVWPERNSADYKLIAINPTDAQETRYLVDPQDIEAAVQLLNESHGPWELNPLYNWHSNVALHFYKKDQAVPSDYAVISFPENIIITHYTKHSGGFSADPALESALAALYEKALSSRLPALTADQIERAAFVRYRHGLLQETIPVEEADFPAICEALSQLPEHTQPPEKNSVLHTTRLELQLYLKDCGLSFVFSLSQQFKGSLYLGTTAFRSGEIDSTFSLQNNYLLPEGYDPFAELGFPVETQSAP